MMLFLHVSLTGLVTKGFGARCGSVKLFSNSCLSTQTSFCALLLASIIWILFSSSTLVAFSVFVVWVMTSFWKNSIFELVSKEAFFGVGRSSNKSIGGLYFGVCSSSSLSYFDFKSGICIRILFLLFRFHHLELLTD